MNARKPMNEFLIISQYFNILNYFHSELTDKQVYRTKANVLKISSLNIIIAKSTRKSRENVYLYTQSSELSMKRSWTRNYDKINVAREHRPHF